MKEITTPLLIVLLFGVQVVTVAAAAEGPSALCSTPLAPEQCTAFVQRLEAGLPAGWRVTGTELGSTPDGWHSRDAVGLLVRGTDGEKTFRLWLLPPDQTVAGESVAIALLDENQGSGHTTYIPFLDDRLRVNETLHSPPKGGVRVLCGNYSLPAGYVWIRMIDVSEPCSEPGHYRISYDAGELKSSQIEFRVTKR